MISITSVKIINLLPDIYVKYICKRLVDIHLKKYAKIIIKGRKNLKDIKRPTIFICNHLSNSDGLVLGKALKDVDPTFVAGVKLSDNIITNIGMNTIKTTNMLMVEEVYLQRQNSAFQWDKCQIYFLQYQVV